MADESVILDYVIKAQDQARGLLADQVKLLGQLSTGISTLVSNQQRQMQAAAAAAKAHQNQGDSLDRLIRLYDQLQKTNQRTVRGFEAMNTSMQAGGKLNQVQVSWLQALNKAVQQNSSFMQSNGQAWNGLMGQMKVGTQVTPQLIGQFNALGKAFQQATGEAQSKKEVLQNVGAAATAAAAAIGGLASMLTGVLLAGLKESINQASLFQNTFLGLGTIAKSFGQDIGATTVAARELASDGLMSVRESAAGLRNLLMAGFGLPEAINLMKGFKDIAAFNRQASLEFGYAIVSATEGIKNQNSLLVDNAGLTKNLTIILKEMGLSEQDLAKVQTDVNIRTKFYNGLLKEMAVASGDAARLTETYSGSVTGLQVQMQLLQAAIGEKFLPVLTIINQYVAQFIGWLRNSDSATAGFVRFLSVAAVAATALVAVLTSLLGILGALAGSIAILTGALVALGVSITTLKTILIGATGIIGIISLLVAGFVAWNSASGETAASLEATLAPLREQQAALTTAQEKLAALKKSSEDTAETQRVLRETSYNLTQVLPGLKGAFTDVDSAARGVDNALKNLNERMRGIELRKIESELSEFGGNEDAVRRRLDTIREYIASRQEDIQRLSAGGASREGIRAIEAEIEVNRQREDRIVSLIERQRELTRQTKEGAEADSQALSEKKNIEAFNRRYNEIIKGQISTTKSYQEAQANLVYTISSALANGMKLDAAMRLPEVVKMAKELTTAAREGVAPMDQLALAIIRRGEAIERTRRLEQEELEHQREQADRLRTLVRAHGDYTAGVESTAKKVQLLASAMDQTDTSFESSREALRPFKDLMQEIVDRVEIFGQEAPANFAQIKKALLDLGGSSRLDEIFADNFNIARQQAAEFNQAMAKLTSDRAEQLMQVEAETWKTVRGLRDQALEESTRTERDSLEKRQDALRRGFEINTRDLDRNIDSQKRIYDAYFSLLQEQLKQLGISWDREFYGPSKTDLQELAAIARKRFDDMRESGRYTATQIRDAWLEWYEAEQQANDKFRKRFRDTMNEALSQTQALLEQIANMAGDGEGGFSGLIRNLALLTSAFQLANKGEEQFAKGLGAIKDGQTLQGIMGITSGLVSMVSAFDQATKSNNKFLNTLGGIQVGSQIGEQIGSIFGPTGAIVGMIGGAIVGGIVGAFRKPEWKKVQEDIKHDLGESISGELAKQIADLKKKLGITRQEAIALSLSAIIAENGGAISKYASQVETLFGLTKRAGETGKKALSELNAVFTTMVTNMNEQMNGMADSTMLKFIQRTREAGVEVKAVTDFLRAMADQAGEALNRVVAGLIGQSTENMKTITDLLDNKIPDLLKKEDELLDKIADEDDPRKLNALKRELEQVREELTKAFAEADRLNAGMVNFAEGGQATFDRMSRLITVTFAAGIGSGKTFLEMLKQIAPSLDYMAQAAEKFGLTTSESFAGLLGLAEFAKLNPMLVESVDGINQLTKALTNMGAMNQQTFNDLGGSLVDMRQQMMDAGATGEQAFAMLQPSLQTLWELQQQFGFEVDEATQKLLDEAKAAGVVGEKHKSATQQMVDGIEKMVDRMERLLMHFGVDFPAEAESSATTAQGAMDDTGAAVDDTTQRIYDGVRAWQEYGAAAQQAGQAGYQATYSTSYGNSPGGLIDVQEKLDALKKQWIEQGKAARGGLGEAKHTIDELMATLTDALHDLEHYTMSDINQQLDTIEQRRIQSTIKFLKDMEGASQEMIDAGLEAINRLAELQSRDAVWDYRHKQEKEALEEQNRLIEEQKRIQEEAEAAAKRWANALRDISESLQTEGLDNGVQRRLLELQFQYQRDVEAFMETMEGATQAQIDQGLAGLLALYALRRRKIEEEAAAEDALMRKRWDDINRNMAQELQLENTEDPLEKKLLSLQFQYQKDVESFTEQMKGATQAQIDEGLRLLEALYKKRREKAQQEAEDAEKENFTKTLRNDMGMGTFSWAGQTPTDRNGVNPQAIAQALQLALADSVLMPGEVVLELPLGNRVERFVVDLTKQRNRDRNFPVELGAVVTRLS